MRSPVAEELDPVFISTTGRTASVVFNMAELTASHLSIAMNGGIITDTGTGPVIVEPPDLGTERRYMFGFEAEDHSERWIYRQCFQSGTLKIARAKGNTVATIATTFSLEKPATGKRLFAAIMDRAKRGGWMVTGGAARVGPIVASIDPATGLAAGGTSVQVNGANLGGATAVTFGGSRRDQRWSRFPRRRYNCDAPAHGAGVVDVAVTTPAGTGTAPRRVHLHLNGRRHRAHEQPAPQARTGPPARAITGPGPVVLERGRRADADQDVSTEGMTFRIDGVLFTCHGRVSAFDLAEFAGRAEDAGPEINDPGVVRILADFMHGLLGDPTYAEVTRHRRVHKTPDSVMQQIIFDLIEDTADRPLTRPSPSPAGPQAPASPPAVSPSPATAPSRGAELAGLAATAWDRLAAEGDISFADLPDQVPEPQEGPARTVSLTPRAGVAS